VNLLGSFITTSSEYSLVRLDFAMRFPERAAPPVLDRLPDASERTLRERWDGVERQLREIVDFVRAVESVTGPERADPAFAALKRAARELDQYARALRWVLTVTEGTGE
jgi:hypothetical protein